MEKIKYVTITEREYLSLRKKHNKYMQFLDTLNKKIDEADKLEERIDKVIEYLKHEQFKRIILGFGKDKYLERIKEETIKILKGEENAKD